MQVTIEESCKFVNSINVDTASAIKFHEGDDNYPHDVVEITTGDALHGYDPISFKTVQDFKTFLKMLMRFDERL
jgi:hypothetical protein